MHLFFIVLGLWLFGSGCMLLGWLAHARVSSVRSVLARKARARASAVDET